MRNDLLTSHCSLTVPPLRQMLALWRLWPNHSSGSGGWWLKVGLPDCHTVSCSGELICTYLERKHLEWALLGIDFNAVTVTHLELCIIKYQVLICLSDLVSIIRVTSVYMDRVLFVRVQAIQQWLHQSQKKMLLPPAVASSVHKSHGERDLISSSLQGAASRVPVLCRVITLTKSSRVHGPMKCYLNTLPWSLFLSVPQT